MKQTYKYAFALGMVYRYKTQDDLGEYWLEGKWNKSVCEPSVANWDKAVLVSRDEARKRFPYFPRGKKKPTKYLNKLNNYTYWVEGDKVMLNDGDNVRPSVSSVEKFRKWIMEKNPVFTKIETKKPIQKYRCVTFPDTIYWVENDKVLFTNAVRVEPSKSCFSVDEFKRAARSGREFVPIDNQLDNQ